MQTYKTKQFIQKAQKVHGDKYLYDKTNYVHSKEKVIITCPVVSKPGQSPHGDFEQTPANHLTGKGCPKCAREFKTKQLTKTTEQFISDAKKIHGTQYDYSKTIYIHSGLKVKITCPIHGDFEQKANSHLTGSGCYKCGITRESKTTEQFISDAKKVHGTKYDYSKTCYIKTSEKVIITCPVVSKPGQSPHGDFEQTPHSHLRGTGCPKCANIKISNCLTKTQEQFISEARKVHGDKYDYSKTKYFSSRNYVIITCPIHGDFEQIATSHLQGIGCRLCFYGNRKPKTTEQFVYNSKKIHGNKYDYSKTNYTQSKQKLIITCPIHGDFEQTPSNHLQGSGCPKCIHQISKLEQEIVDYIKSIYLGPVEQSNRSILSGKELDIYLPELNVAIEFNGLYWHNENNKSNNYHVQKTNDCEKQNIHLIQIFENEWLHKQEIVKSRLKQILGVNKDKKIYGRQCIIRELDAPTERMFMNNNHLQGYVASKVCYGLIYKASNGKEYLVAAMSFGSLRKNLGSSNVDGCYELYRFCNIKNHSVIGGANKLFKHFLKTFKPKKIISFANRRYSFINKNIYQNLGFTFESTTPPSYYYIQGTKLINRFALRKDVLVREYGCPENMSEREFCNEQGWFRIYDSGNLKYIYIP